MFGNDISIDLGTATVLIYVKNKGIVLNEPSAIAVNTDTEEVIAVGEEAVRMIGKTPPYIRTVRPLRDGVISSLTLTQEMIRLFLQKVLAHSIGHPRIMMCVPSGITDVEQRAVIEAARDVGAKDIYVIEEPIAAALGAGYDISRPHGTMVVDIGGGTTDIAVLSLGGVVVSRSLKIAGDEFTEEIIRYMRRDMGMAIGLQTAERLKKEIGGVIPRERELFATAKGLSLAEGLPCAADISSKSLSVIFEDLVFNITERIQEVLEETPPELHSDIIGDGIIMTGSGALIYGLDKRISEAVGVKVTLCDRIDECVVKGAGIALNGIDTVDDPTHIFHKKAYISDI